MKLIIGTALKAADNLALEEAIMDDAEEGVIFLWQSEKAVVIGRNQVTEAEVNLDFLKESGCELVRRSSGGGAVYQDLGNINYSYIHKENLAAGEPSEEDFLRDIMRFLGTFGIAGAFSQRNDLIHGGRKISGTARMQKGEMCLLHGTLLYDVDIAFMEQVLTPSKEKLSHNGVDSVRSRVKNIKDNCNVDVTEFMQMLSGFFCERYRGVQESPECYWDVAENYKSKKYISKKWNYGRDGMFKENI